MLCEAVEFYNPLHDITLPLVQNGLVGEQIRVVSYGEAANRLLTRDGGPEAGMENRRVSLVIDYTGTGIVTDRVVTMDRGGL